MVRFTLKQCTYFRAVAEKGGISQAARALNISQPSVSAAIDKLETMTGLTLFQRHHARGLTLTMQGRLFLEQVERLEAAAAQASNQARALAIGEAGELRLGVFWTLAPFYLPKLIKGFQAQKPQVSVRPSEMSLADLDQALRAGEIDLALTYDVSRVAADVERLPLAEIKLRVYVSSEHRLADRPCVGIEDLRHEPYVMLDGSGSRDYFEGVFERLDITPKIAFRSSSLETVRSAVAAGLGYTFLAIQPPSLKTYDGGQLAALDLAPSVEALRVSLASRTGAPDNEIVRAFQAHARQFFVM